MMSQHGAFECVLGFATIFIYFTVYWVITSVLSTPSVDDVRILNFGFNNTVRNSTLSECLAISLNVGVVPQDLTEMPGFHIMKGSDEFYVSKTMLDMVTVLGNNGTFLLSTKDLSLTGSFTVFCGIVHGVIILRGNHNLVLLI